MSIEKSLDGNQIAQGFIQALQERIQAGKEAIGSKPSVEVELKVTIDKSDLQKAEEALDRLKQGGGAGIGHGGGAAGDSGLGNTASSLARDLEALVRSMENLRQSTRGAADAVGAESPGSPAAPSAGGNPAVSDDEDDEGGRGYYRTETAMGFLRNPAAGVRRLGQDTLLGWLRKTKIAKAFNAKTIGGAVEALGGGALGSVAVGGLGAAALGGGFYAGWKWNESEFGAAYTDSQRYFADMQASNAVGINRRGLTWTPDGLNMQFKKIGSDGLPFYERAAWEALQGMGVSWQGYKGDKRDAYWAGEYTDIAALKSGVSSPAMASFIGGAYQSGTLSMNGGKDGAYNYLSQMVELLREGRDQGITSNERLSTMAGHLQSIKEGSGYVTAGAQSELIEDTRRLSAAGYRDENSRGFMSRLGNNSRPEFINWARQWAAGNQDRLKGYADKYLKGGYAAFQDLGTQGVVGALTENEEFRREFARSVFAPEMLKGGATWDQIRALTGLKYSDMPMLKAVMTPAGHLGAGNMNLSVEEIMRRQGMQDAEAKEQKLGYRNSLDAMEGYMKASGTMQEAANTFKDAVNSLIGRGREDGDFARSWGVAGAALMPGGPGNIPIVMGLLNRFLPRK